MRFMVERFLQGLERFDAWICAWCSRIVGILMAIIASIMFIAVLMRYVFNAPIPWSEDMTGFFLVWMVLLGAAPAMRDRLHVSIDILIEKIPERAQVVGRILGLLIVCFVIWIMVTYGFPFAMKAMNRVMSSLEWLKFGYAYLALPIGYGLMLPICLELIIKDLLKLRELTRASGRRSAR